LGFPYRAKALTWQADRAQRSVRAVPFVLGLPVFLQLAQTHLLHPPTNRSSDRFTLIYKIQAYLERQNNSQSTCWTV